MSAPNWEIEPRPNRYRVDNMALQLRLGLPINIIGVTGGDNVSSNFTGQRSSHSKKRHWNNSHKEVNSNEIRQTVDGIPIRKVYITNIGLEVERREIGAIFGQFGQIMNIFISVSKNDPNKKFAFVTFADPIAAARVLTLHKFQDSRRHYIYAMAADSWHQPKENENGEIIWNWRMKTRQEEENEEDDQSLPVEHFEAVQITEESLNILNDDCLLHIFSFLSLHEVARVEIVCKRWQGLSYQMWRCLHKLSFSQPTLPEMKANNPTLAAYLQRCGPSLRVLDLGVRNHEFDETTLAIVAKNCNNLEVLRLTKLSAGNRSLAHLGRSCPKLKQLFMNECTKFNDKDLMSFLPKCHELSVLNITYNSGISGKFLAKVQSPLVSLHLSHVPTFEAKALIAGLQRMSDSLENLWINACGNLLSGQVEQLVAAVPNLTSFSLCRILSGLKFDSNSLVPIGKLKKLKSINLSLNYAVNDNLLAAIADGCEHLTDINLGSSGGCNGLLTEQGLIMLARLRRLIHLDISYLENTTDIALKGITARNTRLKKLICRGCPDLTDEGCIQVVTVCNDLELFDISGCCHVTERTISAALTSAKMRTNNVPLRLVVGGTGVRAEVSDPDVPLLTVDLEDLSEEHLRPDFIDEMFFPPSDSDEEEDLDHLCCDCDFDFDDLYDPTLFPEGFVGDATIEYEDCDEDDHDLCTVMHWMAKSNDDENDGCDIWLD